MLLKVDEKTSEVTVESFAAVLEWFGPLDGIGMLDRIYNLFQEKYFWGLASRDEADQALMKFSKDKGTFLLRLSGTEPGGFTLSCVVKDGTLQHFRINHKAGGTYNLGSVQYSSLDELLKNSSKQFATMNKKIKFKRPCAVPSPITKLLETHTQKIKLLGYGEVF